MAHINNQNPFPSPLGNSAPQPPPLPIVIPPVDVAAVVPVRLVYQSPIPVRVTNASELGGGPARNPLGDTKRLASVFDRVPRELGGLFKGRALDAGKGAEGLLGMGTGAGAAAGLAVGAGVGVLLAGLGAVKSTFIDPLIGAAHGGFNTGVGRGAGLEVVGKSFEVLGTSVGVILIPATLRLAASALTLSARFDDLANSKIGRLLGASPMTGLGVLAGGRPGDGFVTSAERVRGKGVEFMEGFLGRGYSRYVDALGGRPDPAKTAGQEGGALKDVVDFMKRSTLPPAQTYGVADVRSQVQQIALNRDPLEERMRVLMVQGLEKFINETSGQIGSIADNTKGAGQ